MQYTNGHLLTTTKHAISQIIIELDGYECGPISTHRNLEKNRIHGVYNLLIQLKFLPNKRHFHVWKHTGFQAI